MIQTNPIQMQNPIISISNAGLFPLQSLRVLFFRLVLCYACLRQVETSQHALDHIVHLLFSNHIDQYYLSSFTLPLKRTRWYVQAYTCLLRICKNLYTSLQSFLGFTTAWTRKQVNRFAFTSLNHVSYEHGTGMKRLSHNT